MDHHDMGSTLSNFVILSFINYSAEKFDRFLLSASPSSSTLFLGPLNCTTPTFYPPLGSTELTGTGWQRFPGLPLGASTFDSLLLSESALSLGRAGTDLRTIDWDEHPTGVPGCSTIAAVHLAVGKWVGCSWNPGRKGKAQGRWPGSCWLLQTGQPIGIQETDCPHGSGSISSDCYLATHPGPWTSMTEYQSMADFLRLTEPKHLYGKRARQLTGAMKWKPWWHFILLKCYSWWRR